MASSTRNSNSNDRNNSNPLLFCYHTSNIYAHDLDTLKQGAWLNDAIVAFYMDYLQHSVFSKHSNRFRFLAPTTSFMLMHEQDPDDVADAFSGCGIDPDQTGLVFFPLNDNQNVSKMGGSHWTLLVLDVQRRSFYSFDSMSTSKTPSAAAKKLAEKLAPLLPPARGSGSSSPSSPDSSPSLVSPPSPQQTNGSDCGVFVLCVTEAIAEYRTKHQDDKNSAAVDGKEMKDYLFDVVSAGEVRKKRDALLKLMRDFKP